MNNRDKAKFLRERGMTFEAIGQVLGMSRQGAFSLVRTDFIPIKQDSCVYPNLTRWMNENLVTRKSLLALMKLPTNETNLQKLRRLMIGQLDVKKSWIDLLLCTTGLSYSELFAREVSCE